MARYALSLLVFAFAAACASQLGDPAILPYGGRDAAAAPVGGSDGGIGCRHALTPVQLVSINPLDPAPRRGGAIRVRVSYDRPTCAVLGPIDASLSQAPGTDVVGLATYLWVRGDDCPSVPDSRVVTITDQVAQLSQPMLEIRDLEGAATLSFAVAAQPPNQCAFAALGQTCELDCDCQKSDPVLRCLGTPSGRVCALSCNEDIDCAVLGFNDGSYSCQNQTPPFATCAPGQCATDGECGFGQHCMPGATPSGCMIEQGTSVTGCDCDGDCGFGQICTVAGTCGIPCATAADCASRSCVSGLCLPTP